MKGQLTVNYDLEHELVPETKGKYSFMSFSMNAGIFQKSTGIVKTQDIENFLHSACIETIPQLSHENAILVGKSTLTAISNGKETPQSLSDNFILPTHLLFKEKLKKSENIVISPEHGTSIYLNLLNECVMAPAALVLPCLKKWEQNKAWLPEPGDLPAVEQFNIFRHALNTLQDREDCFIPNNEHLAGGFLSEKNRLRINPAKRDNRFHDNEGLKLYFKVTNPAHYQLAYSLTEKVNQARRAELPPNAPMKIDHTIISGLLAMLEGIDQKLAIDFHCICPEYDKMKSALMNDRLEKSLPVRAGLNTRKNKV